MAQQRPHPGRALLLLSLISFHCSCVSCDCGGSRIWRHQSPTDPAAVLESHHGRSLMIVQPGITKTDGDNRIDKSANRSNAPPFTIKSVSLSLSITPPKVRVTNFMELEPYSAISCRPVLAEDSEEGVASSSSSSSSSSSGTTKVSRLAASSSLRDSMVCEEPLELDATGLDIVGIWLNGKLLSRQQYGDTSNMTGLTIRDVPARPFTLKIISTFEPKVNPRSQSGITVCEGYYVNSFEPYGIQRVTPFLDRPDIMPLWTVRLEADESQLPVLLSNGQLVEQGKLPQGRHYVVWKDPRPHSSYQTTIVAGKLALRESSYTSCITGETIKLKMYLPPQRIKQADFAMYALKAAFAWYEAAWGITYKEDMYTMVGLPGVKGEAAEASQMAVFNVNFLAATPATRTDKDAEAALRLIGHELFHTWSGNYVTVQEWNHLALKEGLTTYMEQAFAADMDTAEAAAMGMIKPRPAFKAPACKAPTDGSVTAAEQAEAAAAGLLPLPELLPYLRGVAACRGGRGGCPAGVQDIEAAGFYWRRIADVAYLRKHQVPEDDGDMPHQLRLTYTSKIWSPYTNTIYRKGAEVIRMYRLMMGPAAFTKGLDKWFRDFYGQAALIEDFHNTMAAASPGSLPSNWLSWYDQPGMPWVSIEPRYDSKTKTLKLEMEQGNNVVESEDGYPGVTYAHLPIPLKVGLLNEKGQNLALQLKGSAAGSRVLSTEDSQTAQLLLNNKTATFTFSNVQQQPVLSVLRGFSAPVKPWVDPQTPEDLALIAKYDRDVFSRYNAVNRLLVRLSIVKLYRLVGDAGVQPGDADEKLQEIFEEAGEVQGVPEALIDAYKTVLAQDLPGGTKAYMLSIPSVQDLENSLEEAEPLLLWRVRRHVGKVLAQQLEPQLQRVIQQADAQVAAMPARGFNAPAMNARHAANNALRVLSYNWSPKLEQQVVKRYDSAQVMSDRIIALQLLLSNARQETADKASSHFSKTFAKEPAAMQEWLRALGQSDRPNNQKNLARVLSTPGLIDLRDHEAVAALLDDGFENSPPNFESEDGAGYKFYFDAIMQVDKVNPPAAASLLGNFADYKGMSKPRRKLVKAQLTRLSKQGSQLSSDLQDTLEWLLEG